MSFINNKKNIKSFIAIIMILVGTILTGCDNNADSGTQKQENEIELPTEVEPQQFMYLEEQLEVEVSNNRIVKIKINSQNEYEKLISQLADYKECTMLYLDLQGKNTTIYLDELLVYGNFGFLEISNGGVISMREEASFADNHLELLQVNHVFQIRNLPIDKFRALRSLTIWLDSQFEASEQCAEIINDSSCDNIIILWKDDTYFGDLKFFEEHIEGGKDITGWEYFINALKNERYFKAFYKLNYKGISYISCEFCNKNMEFEPHIIVKDKSGCLDILEISAEMLINPRIYCGDGQRICLEDINFDGYKDIIFLGYNDGLELYHECIGFLWDQSKQQFELEETMPYHFDRIDAGRKRLAFTSSSSAFYDSYYIYEYINGRFEEKRLDVTFDLNEENLEEITWEYYENGIFLEKLVLDYSEDGNGYYVFYGRDGNISEGTIPKKQMYSELGKRYFEEFDFYNHG